MNGAIHDVENLCWKLSYVLAGRAGQNLLETYQTERWPAQQHNQAVTDATMRFIAADKVATPAAQRDPAPAAEMAR